MTKFSVQYASFCTPTSLRRLPSAIRSLQPFLSQPGMISLGGGMPHPSTFPFSEMTCTLRNGTQLHLDQECLDTALQYAPTPGLPRTLTQLQLLSERYHGPLGNDRRISIMNGSQDGLTKAFDCLVAQEDTLLMEEPTYSGALSYLHALDCKMKTIPTDAEGMKPEMLGKVLKHWNVKQQGKRPRILYTIPTGGNPTGVSLTTARKKAIYALICEYDLLILEDDPYYYLRLEEPLSAVPSFLEMDTHGRVLRFDSLSKIISSGMRFGWITGPNDLLERIDLHTQAANLHPSALTQSIVALLLENWGETGWNSHVEQVGNFYKARRDVFLKCAEKHLSKWATWTVPSAGMFVWLHFHTVPDTSIWMSDRIVPNKVLMVPGSVFLPNGGPSSYVRAAYSTASDEEMDLALARIATVLEEDAAEKR